MSGLGFVCFIMLTIAYGLIVSSLINIRKKK